MRKGFLAEADRLATAVRSELGLGVHHRFDPRVLATEYGIDVLPITDLIAEGAAATSIRQLTAVDDGCFSAGTVLVGTSRLIIFNPVHSDGRLANSVAHELAHVLLEHTPGPAIGPGGCRIWDQTMEEEANTLAAILLVPREAALMCARIGLPHAVGAARFGVSPDLMRWRTDHSGAARQAQAAAKQRGKTIPRLGAADVRAVIGASALGWLNDLPEQEWLLVLAACGRALALASTSALIDSLQPPSAS